MRQALEQAEQAFESAEVPVGAVLVHHHQVIASGWNQRETSQDPTSHAEMLAIRRAAEVLKTWRLTDSVLYVTLEPCPMCAGAIIQSRIPRVVFGTRDAKAGACGSVCDLSRGYPFNHGFEVVSGVLENDCRDILQRFFTYLRDKKPFPKDMAPRTT